jgi:hypothetical protein
MYTRILSNNRQRLRLAKRLEEVGGADEVKGVVVSWCLRPWVQKPHASA